MKTYTNEPVILLVDDDKIIQTIGHVVLTESNFRVVPAYSGEEALKLLADLKPDLILLDIVMPGSNGFDICTKIKSLPEFKETPIIMLTGNDNVESVELAYSNGAWDFTSKPINWPILARRCHKAIAAHQAFEGARKSASLALALDNSNNLILELDTATLSIESVNENGLRILGYRSDELKGSSFDEVLSEINIELDELQQLPQRSEAQISISGKFRCRSGKSRFFKGFAVHSELDGEALLMVIAQDVTELEEQQQVIHRLENYDELTGLPNVKWLKNEYINHCAKTSDTDDSAWLCILDLDGFRKINDSLGYEAGNLILTLSAQRLANAVDTIKQSIRSNLTLALAKHNGDEFYLLVTGNLSKKSVSKVIDQIGSVLNKPLFVDGHELTVTASIGVAGRTPKINHFEELIKNAETAMYQAKAAGKNALRFLNVPEKPVSQAAMLAMESQLRRAIEQDELTMHYQPQIDSETNLVRGVEALVRWEHPVQGWISPGIFVPLAEESSLMIRLGDWVLRRVYQDANDWMGDLLGPACKISLNVSSKQLAEDSFLETVGGLVRSCEVKNPFVFELTESSVASDIDQHMHNLNGLKRLGLEVAIDDFGTGYSSLSYLKDMPIDYLKVDQSFIESIESKVNYSIVKIVFDLAHTLDLNVIAEGVETSVQFEMLQDCGHFLSQGFYHSKALGKQGLTTFIHSMTASNAPALVSLDA